MYRSTSCPSSRASAKIYRRLTALLAAAMTACEAGEDDESERFRERCEQIFACDCKAYRHADIDACMQEEATLRAGWLAKFTAAGLTIDETCMDHAQGPDPDACLTPEAYALRHPDFEPRCGRCSFANGDRQVGEPCVEFDFAGHASDCAPGLSCVGGATHAVCVDPCQPSAEGLPCDFDIACAAGLYCDPLARLCTRAARAGQSCAVELCADGLTCDHETERCIPLAGPDQSCAEVSCDHAMGLVCADGEVCRPIPELGEACREGQCSDGLVCHVASQVCVSPGEVGDLCEQDHHCAVGLYCGEGRCLPGRGPGEPCSDGGEPCRLDLACVDGVCESGHGISCESP